MSWLTPSLSPNVRARIAATIVMATITRLTIPAASTCLIVALVM